MLASASYLGTYSNPLTIFTGSFVCTFASVSYLGMQTPGCGLWGPLILIFLHCLYEKSCWNSHFPASPESNPQNFPGLHPWTPLGDYSAPHTPSCFLLRCARSVNTSFPSVSHTNFCAKNSTLPRSNWFSATLISTLHPK